MVLRRMASLSGKGMTRLAPQTAIVPGGSGWGGPASHSGFFRLPRRSTSELVASWGRLGTLGVAFFGDGCAASPHPTGRLTPSSTTSGSDSPESLSGCVVSAVVLGVGVEGSCGTEGPWLGAGVL